MRNFDFKQPHFVIAFFRKADDRYQIHQQQVVMQRTIPSSQTYFIIFSVRSDEELWRIIACTPVATQIFYASPISFNPDNIPWETIWWHHAQACAGYLCYHCEESSEHSLTVHLPRADNADAKRG
ncbi:hypothetical protein [Chitinophaga flava]|uniref:Uncharacterized protein n=1 Tax=Chitinophaga flava TaxID=2259036 RepID=A0A365XUA8_9BACT|nr:hypothetical protein [Chitinophaga flava]RBL89284.1 hypothetical protein DF182_22445 [Chitinophaga flava]